MARNIITALDIGTSTVETVVAEQKRGDDLKVLGLGIAPAAGIRRGIVVDIGDAAASIRRSVEEARRSAQLPHVKSAWLGVGGSHISVSSSRGVVAVSRADGEISPEDVRRVVAAAETFVAKNQNKEILHIIPRDFKVDNEAGIKDPVGMHGVRLEVDALIIECSAPFLKNLFKSVEGAGLTVDDYVFSPLATAEAVLTKRQKELGVMLLDIGGGTASFIVFEEGVPIHAGVIPIGGNHITNDVAIGFRTQVDVAEQIKLAYGSCLPADLPKRDAIKLADFVPDEPSTYSKRELGEIVEARVRDIFELAQKELKKINRAQLLPAGVVLTGGSSLLPGLVEFAKREIRLPVEIGVPHIVGGVEDKNAPVVASVLGVLEWGRAKSEIPDSGWGGHMSKVSKGIWSKWLRSLLP